ncbi:hypothetical protein Patl1_23248 [Pistacia atlantica]|uniref:Uncharacterized protein n=1 Tax=Pistacia atlantica TaxID=434234 RepID=A0ACC1A0N2_9ROSI|nr:hypothetical protein Patl1_23248 [Pistacia atlantica]
MRGSKFIGICIEMLNMKEGILEGVGDLFKKVNGITLGYEGLASLVDVGVVEPANAST